MTNYHLVIVTLGLLLGLCASCSNNESAPEPVASQAATPNEEQLYLIPPKGWTLSAASNRERFRSARYLRDPAALQLESLTFEYMDPTDMPDPISFLESMAAEQNERCESFSSVAISSGLENGYPSAVRLLRCPRRKVNRASTVSLAKAIAGQDGYYLVVFEKNANSSRGEDGWKSDHVSEEDMARWSLYLRQVTVCDPRTQEHPCPDTAAGQSNTP
ncbi:MAG: hypothetical protein ACR2PZ_11975 [Pseudomonadales bacterium]